MCLHGGVASDWWPSERLVNVDSYSIDIDLAHFSIPAIAFTSGPWGWDNCDLPMFGDHYCPNL